MERQAGSGEALKDHVIRVELCPKPKGNKSDWCTPTVRQGQWRVWDSCYLWPYKLICRPLTNADRARGLLGERQRTWLLAAEHHVCTGCTSSQGALGAVKVDLPGCPHKAEGCDAGGELWAWEIYCFDSEQKHPAFGRRCSHTPQDCSIHIEPKETSQVKRLGLWILGIPKRNMREHAGPIEGVLSQHNALLKVSIGERATARRKATLNLPDTQYELQPTNTR